VHYLNTDGDGEVMPVIGPVRATDVRNAEKTLDNSDMFA
jgi:hypothetical protein